MVRPLPGKCRARRFFEIEALRARALQEHAIELLAEPLASATYRVFTFCRSNQAIARMDEMAAANSRPQCRVYQRTHGDLGAPLQRVAARPSRLRSKPALLPIVMLLTSSNNATRSWLVVGSTKGKTMNRISLLVDTGIVGGGPPGC
jgi:hypothetical protein